MWYLVVGGVILGLLLIWLSCCACGNCRPESVDTAFHRLWLATHSQAVVEEFYLTSGSAACVVCGDPVPPRHKTWQPGAYRIHKIRCGRDHKTHGHCKSHVQRKYVDDEAAQTRTEWVNCPACKDWVAISTVSTAPDDSIG